MPSQLTFRDFITYFSAGALFTSGCALIYFRIIFGLFVSNNVNDQFGFIGSAVTIVLIPVIYFVGHMLNFVNFVSLKYYVWLHARLKPRVANKLISAFLYVNTLILYKSRLVSAILSHARRGDSARNHSVEDFWREYSTLQYTKTSGPADYYYALNEFFKATHASTFVLTVLAFLDGSFSVGLVFLVLSVVCYVRAGEFAILFVKTVERLGAAVPINGTAKSQC
ncbi:MAG: hypothetical protein H6873_01190 [Hyphomicrobiaceae bacterium]|nr:hypothetical protein [Hyphomicrobiaceae bacterium]